MVIISTHLMDIPLGVTPCDHLKHIPVGARGSLPGGRCREVQGEPSGGREAGRIIRLLILGLGKRVTIRHRESIKETPERSQGSLTRDLE